MEFLKGIGAARFGVMAGVAAALTAFFLYVAGVISEPPQAILFAGLAPRDASQVTSKLDAMNIPYTLKNGGGTIMVPADQAEKLRMDMASQNLPSAGVGYEIFDKTDTFGTTAFVQNINRLRALEGELTRSIDTIDNIEASRVHLVIPERQVFSNNTEPPTASVVVKVRGSLGREQVAAIQHLVAASVAGLVPSRVAIIDDRGDLLAGGDGKDGADAGAAEQDQHTAEYEDRLRRRIENIIAGVVGPGHVRVQVAADIEYKRIQQTSQTYDGDAKVPRSTQSVTSTSSDSQGDNNNAMSVSAALPNPNANSSSTGGANNSSKSVSSSDSETTNYEIPSTTTSSVDNGGTLKRLSVAVLVDGDLKALGDGKTKYEPRSKQEMAQIQDLVKSAVGFDKARGDQVEVVNMPFARMDVAPLAPDAKPLLGLDSTYWFKIIEAAILSIVALLLGLFVVRPLIRNMFAPQAVRYAGMPALPPGSSGAAAGQLPAPPPAAGEAAALAGPEMVKALPEVAKPSMIDIARIEGQVRESSIRKVGEVVDAHPEEALSILRTWLHQPV